MAWIFSRNSLEARRRIGYLPENPPLYNEMRVEAYLRFAGKLRGVPRGNLEDALEHVLDVCGLEGVRHPDLRAALQGLPPAGRAGRGDHS